MQVMSSTRSVKVSVPEVYPPSHPVIAQDTVRSTISSTPVRIFLLIPSHLPGQIVDFFLLWLPLDGDDAGNLVHFQFGCIF